jgi:fructose-1,6-bisphosphatase/inositol monophosphatase family enzyme
LHTNGTSEQIIDPLDGTTNFVHGFPFVVTSIGVAVRRELVVGVVYNPFLNELFTAVKGRGAYRNDQPIRVSNATTVQGSLLSTNFGHDRSQARLSMQLGAMQRLLQVPCHGLRAMGAAAAAMCDAACGRVDAFYEDGIKVCMLYTRDLTESRFQPWDVAAGAVIVSEAGGVVLDTDGGPFDVMSGRVLAAATPALGQALASAICPPSTAGS